MFRVWADMFPPEDKLQTWIVEVVLVQLGDELIPVPAAEHDDKFKITTEGKVILMQPVLESGSAIVIEKT